jgi:hypothetical protein
MRFTFCSHEALTRVNGVPQKHDILTNRPILGTPVRGVSRTRERVAPGVSTASAAPGWQGRPAFGVSRCQTGEIWRIQKCQ